MTPKLYEQGVDIEEQGRVPTTIVTPMTKYYKCYSHTKYIICCYY